MSSERIRTPTSFEEFWPFYVKEHSKKATRVFHFAGTTAFMAMFAGGIILKKRWLVALSPLAGYGPAWFSHFFIEGNKPATFKHPVWSLKADFIMWSKMVAGTMDAEVERVMHAAASQPSGAERSTVADN